MQRAACRAGEIFVRPLDIREEILHRIQLHTMEYMVVNEAMLASQELVFWKMSTVQLN